MTKEFMMKELPFLPEFKDVILHGRKTQTARTTRKGITEGEVVKAVSGRVRFAILRILSIEKRSLGTFTEADAQREGMVDMDEFIEVWKRIHYRHGFDPYDQVFVFRFEVVEEKRGEK